MPTSLIPPITPPIPRFTPASGQLTGPADGDALLAASVNGPFAQLADRTTLSFAGLYGVSGSRLVAYCTDGLNIEMNSQAALRSSSGVLSGMLGPIDIATVLGSSPVADTWYYVYGADVAGVLTPIISTDPPDATLKYRSGNADHMFLTLFNTDSSADVILFSHYEGCYIYLGEISALARTNISTVTPDPIALPNVPPFARQAFVSATIYNIDPLLSSTVTFFYPAATVGKSLMVGDLPTGSADIRNSENFLMPIDGQTGFEALRSGGTSDTSVVLHGFPI